MGPRLIVAFIGAYEAHVVIVKPHPVECGGAREEGAYQGGPAYTKQGGGGGGGEKIFSSGPALQHLSIAAATALSKKTDRHACRLPLFFKKCLKLIACSLFAGAQALQGRGPIRRHTPPYIMRWQIQRRLLYAT